MSFAYHKWTPDTHIRLLNFGKGILEVTVAVKPDKKITGKKITLEPLSDKLVTVRDLLPPQFVDFDKLNDDNLVIHIKNIGKETSSFNMEDYGPFNTTTAPDFSQGVSAQDMIDCMQHLIAEADFYSMTQLLKNETPEKHKESRQFYGLVTMLKGQMSTCVFSFDDADRYYEEAWDYLEEETRLWCCFHWATALMHKMMLDTISLPEKGKAIQKAVQILDRIPALTTDNPFIEYDLMAVKCKKAFCLCYLGEEEEALKMFDDFTYPVISKQDYDNPLLSNFFSSVDKGFWVAIELSNGDLLKKLSSMIACKDEAFIKEDSPVRSMRIAVAIAVKKNIKAPFTGINNLFKNGHHYAPEFKNLREFIKLSHGKDEKAIDHFIYYTDRN
ncbi:MAG TPA: hypothetical protein VI757_10205 [Bacteroidia bacterium]|nr:hypothetical protein [Bacteroidia bacterium]